MTIHQSLRVVLGLAALISLSSRAEEANQLTPSEKAAGWKLLFDGRSTAQWRSFHKETFPTNGWVVQDGWLKCVAGGRGGDIITREEFDDFELEWDWRLPAKANNGVKYFITEARQQALGHEYQMVDDSIERNAKEKTAGFYQVLPPQEHRPMHLAPETNHSRILVHQNHVEHWLNGEKVLEYECGSNPVKEGVAKSKFRNVQGFGEKIKGHILLTEHHDEAWFRNIKIRTEKSP